MKSGARSILEPFEPSIEQTFINPLKRYEYHFSDDVINQFKDIKNLIEFSDHLRLSWQYAAELVIDHKENIIIKNRFPVRIG